MHLIGIARIPVFVVCGVIGAELYMRGIWWLCAKRAAAIDAVEM